MNILKKNTIDLKQKKNWDNLHLLSDMDIIIIIKKEKNAIFFVNKKILNYTIILEALKEHGNYIFLNPGSTHQKINLQFLYLEQFESIKIELKKEFYNERFSRKYSKLFNIINKLKIQSIKKEINNFN